MFAVSGALASRIREIAGVEPIHLPIGVDHRAIAAMAVPRDEARRALDLPEDRVIVLFAGRLVRDKGVLELVMAVLDLGDPFLAVFVGAGPEHGHGTDDPRADGCLLFRGAQPHQEVIRYMAAADVLVLPSYGEGLPTVLVEAGSIGLPVIGSAVGGIPELLGDGRGTVMPDVTPASIRDALVAFRASADDRRVRAERLRLHVLERYDVDRNAGRLLAYYREIAGSRGR